MLIPAIWNTQMPSGATLQPESQMDISTHNGTFSSEIFSKWPSLLYSENIQAGLKLLHIFWENFNVSTPFQVTKCLLCSFAAFLADENLTHQTSIAHPCRQSVPDPRDSSS